jgi:hypothetical protein
MWLRGQPTLAHPRHEWTPNHQLMTMRRHRGVLVVKEAILEFMGDELRSDIFQSSQIQDEGRAEQFQAQRPNVIFQRQRGGN